MYKPLKIQQHHKIHAVNIHVTYMLQLSVTISTTIMNPMNVTLCLPPHRGILPLEAKIRQNQCFSPKLQKVTNWSSFTFPLFPYDLEPPLTEPQLI